ncbi:MAG TPA: trehalose-6-phosphate synthase [Thermoanaerobaculia bacterium]|nr:trehalose-6-phosphate synthase [Thermoanaerobaculia bacterium]
MSRIVVIANREPYAHERDKNGGIVVRRPASGLVTGIEPMLRRARGTWIAYGGGSADRETADRSGRVAVPPGAPEYTLRRMFVDEHEYARYYAGFANEALWPLCHIAHTRPHFRRDDWMAYERVNAAFARAGVEESAGDGLLLIQDYHFALVPRLVRREAPDIVTSLFWHIPWPSAELVEICPWKDAIVGGMLGADVVGFHTRQYCMNFLETVSRGVDCDIDEHEMSITTDDHRTLVREYPISVQWPYPAAPRSAGRSLRQSLGIGDGVHVALGIDRADYTKGLLEKVGAIEALLERNPDLAGRFVLVQIASPTRSVIREYARLASELRDAVARVNDRFGNDAWRPILLLTKTVSPAEVREFYAMADSAIVTPLHDGMNLVAKEYAASCNDGEGVLVLSRFAGAAKELDTALIVNPYDVEQVARAIVRAMRMPAAERHARMQTMRARIAAHTIDDWSQSIVSDMIDLRSAPQPELLGEAAAG